jgi:hypothetical protein
MDLVNETDLQAALFRSVLPDPDRLMGVVVARATYSLDARGGLTRDMDDPVPVSRDPIPLPSGELPGDQVPRKEGVDLLALGHVRAPDETPVVQLPVTLMVGEFVASVMVYGDRAWRRKPARPPPASGSMRRAMPTAASVAASAEDARVEYEPSDPDPFTELPMTWERAYGGAAEIDGRRIPHPDNALGRGYLVPGAPVEGVPLPNLEDPAALLRRCDENPRPLCLAPLPRGSLFQSEDATSVDEETGAMVVHARFFNVAHPRFRVPALLGGEDVTLTGMTAGGPFAFTVPSLPLHVEVLLEKRRYSFPIRVDTLCLLPDERRVVLTWRAPFTYRYIREEVRVARLWQSARSAATPSSPSSSSSGRRPPQQER